MSADSTLGERLADFGGKVRDATAEELAAAEKDKPK